MTISFNKNITLSITKNELNMSKRYNLSSTSHDFIIGY